MDSIPEPEPPVCQRCNDTPVGQIVQGLCDNCLVRAPFGDEVLWIRRYLGDDVLPAYMRLDSDELAAAYGTAWRPYTLEVLYDPAATGLPPIFIARLHWTPLIYSTRYVECQYDPHAGCRLRVELGEFLGDDWTPQALPSTTDWSRIRTAVRLTELLAPPPGGRPFGSYRITDREILNAARSCWKRDSRQPTIQTLAEELAGTGGDAGKALQATKRAIERRAALNGGWVRWLTDTGIRPPAGVSVGKRR